MKTSNQTLFDNILSTHSHILKRVEGALGSVHGLGLSEYLVLHRLSAAPTKMMSRVELADQVGLTASGVTRLLQPMEKIGLVQRKINERDARKSMVELSSTGARKFTEAQVSFEESLETIFDTLSNQERQSLSSSLKLIA
ncbi:MAG: MarR family transcriptional regulator [Arenicella sp.]|jgi:DNA-binding MarR family transcriptional regulator|nr:MarR family transcriptional regulator [Arenicella sp.]HAU67826.1 transcriptional regulator [Gammaproteobacteria bacterium]